jgi:phospholipase C
MTTMPQIETIVLLMLENRSLDSMLGWLYDDHPPARVYPTGTDPRFNGIRSGMQNQRGVITYRPTSGSPVPSQRSRMPRWGPKEDLENVQVQMYGNGAEHGHIADRHWGKPPMTGFAWNFPTDDARAGDVMSVYNAADLPVLYTLAEGYAVSDRWFSSVPTETDANRAYSLCGTSGVIVDDVSMAYFHQPTLFNGLWDETWSPPNRNKTWGIYYQYTGIGDLDPTIWERWCSTADRFPKVHDAIKAKQGTCSHYSALLDALRKGEEIPQFCYIEPYWSIGVGFEDGSDFVGVQGNDYHAPAWIGAAEFDLNELYEALRSSRQWEHMLFIITFDEHGGTWDHEPPPTAFSPEPGLESRQGFQFDRLGVRVPTILVSPYVEPGMVFRAPGTPKFDFDHTSFIKTILEWAGTDTDFLARMGNRVVNAPTFDGVLSDTAFPDSDLMVTVPAAYAAQSAMKGKHNLDLDGADLTLTDIKAAVRDVSSPEEFVTELRRRAGL